MNERSALRRGRARRGSGGFTLVELMIVVVLVAVLAALASPSMQQARNDRIAFDYARQYQQILGQARSRAAGTGSAHLVLMTASNSDRGVIRLYAALDGVANPGPGPVASCKLDPAQWTAAEPAIADYRLDTLLTGNKVRFINFADMNRAGVNEEMGLKSTITVGDGANAAMAGTSAVAVCITPSGITYVGSGSTTTAAVTAMRSATPFTGVVDVAIQRHSGSTGIGLKRRLIVSGGGAPRLRSE